MQFSDELSKADINQLLSYTNQPTILEIGANDGSDSEQILKAIPGCTLYCFEPDIRAYAKLNYKLGSYNNAKLFQLAVSDNNGKAEFNMSNSYDPNLSVGIGWDKSGSIKKPINHIVMHPWCKFDSRVTVTTITLDSWVKQNNVDKIDFIWADVQGAEREMILGAKETLKNINYIYTEYSPIKNTYDGDCSLEDLVSLLDGFEMLKDFGCDVLFKNKSF